MKQQKIKHNKEKFKFFDHKNNKGVEQSCGSDFIHFLLLGYTNRSILSIKNNEYNIGFKNYELTKKTLY